MNNSNQGVNLTIKNNAIETVKSLSSILERLDKITLQLDAIIVGANSMTNSFEKGAKKFDTFLQKSSKVTKETNSNLNKSLKNMNFESAVNNLKSYLKTAQKFTNYFVNYIEDLNLLKVAFGDTADEAKKMIENIADITGFDESTLVRMTATFRQLTSTMGLGAEYADLLATNLTKMSLDVSSLYNIDLETAKYALQGALTAQPRSIKTHTGADITQDTLQAELARLGIDRKVRSLNQAEKAIITYLSLERQLINSNGDLARTIEQPANQLRVFKEQLTRAGRSIGNLFIPILQKVLPYLNAFLMVFSEIIEVLMGVLGIDTESFWDNIETGTGNITNNLDGITESAKKAQMGLRGFDKLNVIKTPSSDSGSGDLGLGVDSEILKMLEEYDLKLDDIKQKATEIRDRIMDWLGFAKDEDGKWFFKEVTWGTVLTSIVGITAGFKLVHGAIKTATGLLGGFGASATTASTTVNGIASTLGTIALGATAVITVVYAGVKLKKVADEIKSVNGEYEDLEEMQKKLIEVEKNIQKELITGIETKDLEKEKIKSVIATVKDRIKMGDEEIDQIQKNIDKMSTWEKLTTNNYQNYRKQLQLNIEQNQVSIETLEKVAEAYDYDKEKLKDLGISIDDIKTKMEDQITNLENLNSTYNENSDEYQINIDKIADLKGKLNDLNKNEYQTEIEKLKKKNEQLDTSSTEYQNNIDKIKDLQKKLNELPESEEIKVNVKAEADLKKAKEDYSNWLSDLGEGFSKAVSGFASKISTSVSSFFKGDTKGFWDNLLNFRADGGFVDTGQLFIAREAGAELVGTIGNKTAVANNQQIVDAVAQGVSSAILASGGFKNNFVIEAHGDADGMMNFITLKQKEQDMQFGD